MITKEIKDGKIRITSNKELIIEVITIIKDNGKIVSKTKAIKDVITPIDNTDDKGDKIKKLSKVLHTKKIKDNYKKLKKIK